LIFTSQIKRSTNGVKDSQGLLDIL